MLYLTKKGLYSSKKNEVRLEKPVYKKRTSKIKYEKISENDIRLLLMQY